MTSGLSWLLSPVSVEEFLEHYWTQRPLHVQGGERRFEHLLAWCDYSSTLESCLSILRYPTLRLVASGKVIPERAVTDELVEARGEVVRRLSAQKISLHCREGATLVVAGFDRLSPAIRDLARGIASEMGQPVQVNSYHSQPGVQGFDLHYDTHEIVVLQVEGSKRWTVYGASSEFPLPRQAYFGTAPPEAGSQEYALTKGDVLYVPRGAWHCAAATDEESLHLTLGVHTQQRVDLAKWLINRLEADVWFRRDMPVRFGAQRHYYSADIERVIQRLGAYLTEASACSDALSEDFDIVRRERTAGPPTLKVPFRPRQTSPRVPPAPS